LQLKIIDFGSSYLFEEKGNISTATPEYIAPEILEILHNRKKYASTD